MYKDCLFPTTSGVCRYLVRFLTIHQNQFFNMLWAPQTFHVTGFHADTTACELTVFFEKNVDEIYRVDIPPRSLHGKVRPYAFVQFMKDQPVKRIETVKLTFRNQPLFIRLSHNSRNPDKHQAFRIARKDERRHNTDPSECSERSVNNQSASSLHKGDLRNYIESQKSAPKRTRSPSHEESSTKRPRATRPSLSPVVRSPPPVRGRSRSRSASTVRSAVSKNSISSRSRSRSMESGVSNSSVRSLSRSKSPADSGRSMRSMSRSQSPADSVGSIKSMNRSSSVESVGSSKNSVRSMSRSRSRSRSVGSSRNSGRSRSRSMESAISLDLDQRESSIESDIVMVDRE